MRASVLCTLCLAALLAAPVARAKTAPDDAAADRRPSREGGKLPAPGAAAAAAPLGEAAAAFQSGHRAFEGGDYEAAREHYERAERLSPHPNTLYNLALTCERLLDYDAALAAFERYLRLSRTGTDSEAAPDARQQRMRRLLAERSLRRLRNLPARISVSAVPEVVTATVTPLDPPEGTPGETARAEPQETQTPGIFTVPAGRYRLTFQRDGYFSESVEVDAHVGQALLLQRQLRARPRTVRIESQPSARLFLDDRLLGQTPYQGEVPLGSHRLRLEKRFFLTQLRPLELPAGSQPLRFRIALEASGRVDMLIGGALAGAGLGLMVLRIFQGEIENIENMPAREIYKPLAAALLPAALGASVAGLAGWEMPVSEAQLLIGSAAWGSLIGFGTGLGAQPQGLLPHVLAVGGGVVGGTLGTAVWRFRQPSSGAVALFNSTALWGAGIGALSWAYTLSYNPRAGFFGQPSDGRTGEGGWIVLGSTLAGVGIGAVLANLPPLRGVSRLRMALIDLGGLSGGLVAGALGMGVGYVVTRSWEETARIAVPSAIAGIGAGILTAAILTRNVQSDPPRGRVRPRVPATGPLATRPSLPRPELMLGGDGLGGTLVGARLVGGTF